MAARVTSRSQRLPSRSDLLLLASVMLLATVLRIGWPTLTEFKFSEARLAALALEITREGRLPLVGVPSSAGFDHSPISVYLYAPAFLLTTNPIPATIYGGLIGVAAVLLCWQLARRWPEGGRLTALVAALLFAVGPWSVVFSRKIWQVAFVPFLTLAFIGLMMSALIDGKRWWLAWSLVVYALLVQVHPSAVSLAPAVILWLVVCWREVRLQPLLVGGILGALTGVPFIVHQVQHGWPVLTALQTLPSAAGWDSTAYRLAWEMITGQGIHALAGNAYPLLEAVPQIAWTFNLLGWLVTGAILWLTWRTATGWKATDAKRQKQARIDLFLLSWLVMPIVLNLRPSLDLHLHFFALVAPAAYLIVGRAAGALVQRSTTSPVRIAGAVGMGLLTVAQVVALVLMGCFVATHDTPGGFGTPLNHYLAVSEQTMGLAARKDAVEVLVVGEGDSAVVDEVPAIFDVLLRGRVSYRFVDGQSAALFPTHRALVLLAPGGGEAGEWYDPWPSITSPEGYQFVAVDGSWPEEGLDPVAGPRVFQNGVELQAYAWQGDGRQMRFWLLWQVLWLSPEPTHFSVRLSDEEGQPRGQQDAVGYPTTYRRKGDRIISEFYITLSPEALADPYWAQVGVYLYPEVISLPVVDGSGKPVAGAVVLGPLGGRP
jgi:4-amino-4-deoxy-L-arabinose transferase-like glycosyltransferase